MTTTVQRCNDPRLGCPCLWMQQVQSPVPWEKRLRANVGVSCWSSCWRGGGGPHNAAKRQAPTLGPSSPGAPVHLLGSPRSRPRSQPAVGSLPAHRASPGPWLLGDAPIEFAHRFRCKHHQIDPGLEHRRLSCAAAKLPMLQRTKDPHKSDNVRAMVGQEELATMAAPERFSPTPRNFQSLACSAI